MKNHRVTITIFPPRESDDYPGQVEEGNYFHEDNVVTLVSHAGVPLRDKRQGILQEARRRRRCASDCWPAPQRILSISTRKELVLETAHYPKLGLA